MARKNSYPRNKPAAPTMARMLPTCRAMEYAQVSERTLHRWYEQGLVQKYRVGGRLRWSMDELDALIVGRVAS